MKHRFHYCSLTVLIGILISSCVSDVLEHHNDFEASNTAWLDFKESSDTFPITYPWFLEKVVVVFSLGKPR